jgi:hypothetical protein
MRRQRQLTFEILERIVKFYETKPDPAKAAGWQATLDALRAANPFLSPPLPQVAPAP